ncbi:MAG: MarR family transcriptional regulator [Rhodobacteraceae bacterium]|nr:MarR family transcriptional regulator [Paracoccaceae bacterium]
MTDPNAKAPKTPPHFQDSVAARLSAAGHADASVQALLDLDAAIFQWHRMAMKGEVVGRLIAELGEKLELSQFYAMTAITRIEAGVGRPRPEPATVGLLAEELSLDPSRASRIATDLIAAGYVRREVAQDDGRKTVLVLTDRAKAVFDRFRDLKWGKLITIFAEWSEDDIQSFSRLFDRYAQDVARVYRGLDTPE